MIKEGKTLNTRELFYYARELMEHHQYDKAIVYFEKFLIQKDGWKENKIEACLDLSYCYREMNNSHKALQILLYSFLFDNPRSEIMCQIGLIFMSLEQYEQAIYWYLKALENQRDENSGAFVQKSCYDFIPYIQLCVCYDRLGNHELAYQYNELAGKLKPNDPSYLFNQAYFSKILDLKRP